MQYAQTSGATRIFFYVQTFIGNRTNDFGSNNAEKLCLNADIMRDRR